MLGNVRSGSGQGELRENCSLKQAPNSRLAVRAGTFVPKQDLVQVNHGLEAFLQQAVKAAVG